MIEENMDRFYQLLYGSLSINNFAQWVYDNDSLKELLSENDYLELISVDYRQGHAKYEVEKIIKKYIDYGSFEKQRLVSLLKEALARRDTLPDILRTFYEMYCCGYTFLQDLGLGYGLSCEAPLGKNYTAQTWEELSEAEQKKLIDGFFPKLRDDLERALDWLENDRIILTGEKDDLSRWGYIDHRTEQEKKSSIWMEVYQNPENGESVSKNILWDKQRKKWWEFWK